MTYTHDRTTGERSGGHYGLVRSLVRAGTTGAAGLIAAGVLLMLAGGGALAERLTLSGLVALVLIPVMRVVVEGWSFARRGEWLFALISLMVLIALGVGMAIGATH